MPRCFKNRKSVCYETKVIPHWDRQALAEIAHAFTYEVTWIPERQLAELSALGQQTRRKIWKL
jgi:hypothetical protein